MATKYRVITVSKEDLQKALAAFDELNAGLITMAIEFDSINGDQILWASNSKFGDEREVEIINMPHGN